MLIMKQMFVFGTYRINKSSILKDSVNQAMNQFTNLGLPLLVDSAYKYNNADALADIIKNSNVKVGWKINPNDYNIMSQHLQKGIDCFPNSLFFLANHQYKN